MTFSAEKLGLTAAACAAVLVQAAADFTLDDAAVLARSGAERATRLAAEWFSPAATADSEHATAVVQGARADAPVAEWAAHAGSVRLVRCTTGAAGAGEAAAPAAELRDEARRLAVVTLRDADGARRVIVLCPPDPAREAARRG
jgi:hypothetical protein